MDTEDSRHLITIGIHTNDGIRKVDFVRGFYFEDGYCVYVRHTDRGIQECCVPAWQVVLGCV